LYFLLAALSWCCILEYNYRIGTIRNLFSLRIMKITKLSILKN
jgi:hypothetical protein